MVFRLTKNVCIIYFLFNINSFMLVDRYLRPFTVDFLIDTLGLKYLVFVIGLLIFGGSQDIIFIGKMGMDLMTFRKRRFWMIK